MELYYLITISDRDRAEMLSAIYHAAGTGMVLTKLGRGTATGEQLSSYGLDATEKADFQGGEAEALYRHPRKRRDDGNSAQKRGWWQDAGLFDRFYTDRRKTRDGFFA